MDRFIIFAVARSGSSSLCRILDSHPSIACVNEPFVPEHATADINTMNELTSALDNIYRRATGIKHVWTASGWPLPGPAFTEALLKYQSPKIIFLVRRNYLQQYVSEFISQQSNVWQPTTAQSGRAKILDRAYNPIDLYDAQRGLDEMRERTTRYRKLLDNGSAEVFDLTYEEIFGATLSLEQRRIKLNEIVSFLGYSPNELDENTVTQYLDPACSKLNTDVTYRLIPNIRQIDLAFSSEEYGHLFELDGQGDEASVDWRNECRDALLREISLRRLIDESKTAHSALESELQLTRQQASELRNILDLPSHRLATKAAKLTAKLRNSMKRH